MVLFLSYWLPYIIYGILLIFSISMVWYGINLFKKKPKWGQARVMGITAAGYIWIQFVFYLALAETGWGIISLIGDFPIWLDVSFALLIIVIAISLLIYFKFKRNKFNLVLFSTLVLVPLGFPSSAILLKLTKIGTIEVTQKIGIFWVKSSEKYLMLKTAKGVKRFANSHTIGALGEIATNKMMKNNGYMVLPTKTNKIHGIDTVAIKCKTPIKSTLPFTGCGLDQLPEEIVIVETKVNSSQLNTATKQMSDEWVQSQVSLLIESPDKALQETGQLLENAYKQNFPIEKRLYNHITETGITNAYVLDRNGAKVGIEFSSQTPIMQEVIENNCIMVKNICRLN